MSAIPPRCRGKRQRRKTKHYTDDDPATFTTKGKIVTAAESVEASSATSSSRSRKKHPWKPFQQQQRQKQQPQKQQQHQFQQLQHQLEPNSKDSQRSSKLKRKRPFPISQQQAQQSSIAIVHHQRRIPIIEDATTLQTASITNEPIFGRGLGRPLPLPKPTWQPLTLQTSNTSTTAKSNRRNNDPVTCSHLSNNSPYLATGHATGQVTIYSACPRLLPVSTITTTAQLRELQQQHQQDKGGGRKYAKQRMVYDHSIVAIHMSGEYVVLASTLDMECWNAITNTRLWNIPLSPDHISCHSLDMHPISNQVLASMIIVAAQTENDCSIPATDATASNSTTTNTTSSTTTITTTQSPLWLLDVDASNNKRYTSIIPIDKERTPIVLHTKCTAIWDKSNSNRFLVAGAVDNSISLLLVLCNNNIVLQQLQLPHKLIKQLNLESLRQSPNGYYTLVGSTRGIRLLETNTFITLLVYGDNLSLHGHSIIWQDAFFLTKQQQQQQCNNKLNHDTKNEEKNDDSNWMNQSSVWIVGVPNANRPPLELHDILHIWDILEAKHVTLTLVGPDKCGGFTTIAASNDGTIMYATTKNGECSTLRQTFTTDFAGIMYPPGYQIIDDNLEFIEDEDECDDAVIEHDDFAISSAMATSSEEEEDDEDLAIAMRLSMLEQKKHEQEEAEDVDIIGHDDDATTSQKMIPCRPTQTTIQVEQDDDNNLALKNDEDDDDTVTSASVMSPSTCDSVSFLANVIKVMPHASLCDGTTEKHKASKEEIYSEGVQQQQQQQQTVRQKRTKAASLEALRRASLNPTLRKIMLAKEFTWTNGIGSSVAIAANSDNVSATTETSHHKNKDITSKTSTAPSPENGYHDSSSIIDVQSPGSHESTKNGKRFDTKCMACHGRWVFHSCGNRSIPVDYDELKRAQEEQKFQLEEELKKQRAAKRKLADAKRRIMKKKKRAEEEAILRVNVEDELKYQVLSDEGRKREPDLCRQYPPQEQNKEKRRAEMLERLSHVMEESEQVHQPPTAAYSNATVLPELSNYSTYNDHLSLERESSHNVEVSSTYPPDTGSTQSFYRAESVYGRAQSQNNTSYEPSEAVHDENSSSALSTYEQETYSNAELLQAATYTTDNTTSYAEMGQSQSTNVYSNGNSVYDHSPAYTGEETSYTPTGHHHRHSEYSYDHSDYSATTLNHHHQTPSYLRYSTPNSDQFDAIDALAALASAATSRSFESTTPLGDDSTATQVFSGDRGYAANNTES